MVGQTSDYLTMPHSVVVCQPSDLPGRTGGGYPASLGQLTPDVVMPAVVHGAFQRLLDAMGATVASK